MKVIAPLRDRVWTRDEELAYAADRGIPVVQKPASPYSVDENLLGRSIEAGVLEDPWLAPPEGAFALTRDPVDAPAHAEVVISFEQGLPTAVDGVSMPLHELVASLNAVAGAYGVGRIDMVENRAVGIKSRELYEAPAALVLVDAHRALEDLVLTKAELRAKRWVEEQWTELVYAGGWFSPLRQALDAFVDTTQEVVSGEVRVQLRAGSAVVTGRRSEHGLYAETLASYATGETFPHEAAEGFLRIVTLEAELAAARAKGRVRA